MYHLTDNSGCVEVVFIPSATGKTVKLTRLEYTREGVLAVKTRRLSIRKARRAWTALIRFRNYRPVAPRGYVASDWSSK